MSRERERSRYATFSTLSYNEGGVFTDTVSLDVEHEFISDENHTKKWKGSNGPCNHMRSSWTPNTSLRYTDDFGVTIVKPTTRGAGFISQVSKDLVSAAVADTVVSLQQKIFNEYARGYERFDLINAVAGLADCGGYFKAISKYRYLDWEFGLAPTIADAKTAYERTFQSVEETNVRLKAAAKPSRFSKTKFVDVSINETRPYFFGDYSDTIVHGHCTVKLSGNVRVEPPRYLSEFDKEWYLWLDKVGFHPDLAALWEAVPFSWLVDWFVPIGNALEKAVGDWYNPTVYIDGWLSFKALLDVELKVPQGSSRPIELWGSSEGTGKSKYYNRLPLSTAFDSRTVKSAPLRLPVPDPRKCAILADIAGALQNPLGALQRTARRTRFNV